MAELEKVIKGLECCFDEECKKCPYQDGPYCKAIPKKEKAMIDIPSNLARDALTLLKAQEARVMPADEIILSAEPSKWLWVERKGDYCAEAYKAGKTISGLIAFECETPCAFLYCEYPGEYGKSWRCWTSRPTDDQREAVKWDG